MLLWEGTLDIFCFFLEMFIWNGKCSEIYAYFLCYNYSKCWRRKARVYLRVHFSTFKQHYILNSEDYNYHEEGTVVW
jgi:hypothetical protein